MRAESEKTGLPADPNALTVLRAHDGRRLAKTFFVATNGVIAARAYDRATWFTAESVPVRSLPELHRLLRRLERDTEACVIRGALQPQADPARLRRRKTGEGAPFADAPRSWVMLDLDRVPLASGVLDEPADAARALLDLLAAAVPELEGVSAIVQFSASAGLLELAEAEQAAGLPPRWGGVAKPGVSAHVWFWLRRPLAEAELLRWRNRVAASGLDLDPATLRTVQPHYTAAPLFTQPLRDPLAGRRTVLVPGMEDAAELLVPAPESASAATGSGPSAHAGIGFIGHLDAIGGSDGFRQPILRAIASYVAVNYPDPDTTELKAALRTRIAKADPGGRTVAELRRYASDAHLDEMIRWCMQQETQKRARGPVALPETVPPTYPDRSVPLTVARAQTKAIIARFAQRIAAGETPNLLLRATPGAGKSHEVIDAAPDLLEAANSAGKGGALHHLVPRHNLSGELRDRIAARHPELPTGMWRGVDWVNPEDPTDRSCLDPELPRAAAAAGLAPSAACVTCKLACQYKAQRRGDAKIQLGAANLALRALPNALPDAAALVLDEDFTSAAIAGVDKLHPIQLAVSALHDTSTGGVTGIARERLLFLRRLAADAIERQDHDGGLLRDVFVAVGFTADSAKEWAELEWETKPKVKLQKDMPREAVLELLAEAAAGGFTRLRPLLARSVRDLLNGRATRAIGTELVRAAELGRGRGNGAAIRFRWVEPLAPWAADTSKLLLDATAEPEILRHFISDLEVIDVEVAAPHQHVHQIVGRDFGRSFFVRCAGNVRHATDLIVCELARTDGAVLVIAQESVESLLADELTRRFDLAVPDRLHLAHFGDITGLDRYRDVATVIVLGRPALARTDAERLAELIQGAPVQTVADEDPVRWPTAVGGIRRPDGTGTPVRQPTHPDPLVEAVRRSVTEGSVMQAIARGRGVQRTEDRPVRVVLVNDLALPLTVETVTPWEDACPDRLTVAAAEAALTGGALPLHPQDLATARPDLWRTPAAAERDRRRGKSGQSLYGTPINGMSEFRGLLSARYRKAGTYWRRALVPPLAGREALQSVVEGVILDFELLPSSPLPPPPPPPASRRRSSPPALAPAIPVPAAPVPAPALHSVAGPAPELVGGAHRGDEPGRSPARTPSLPDLRRIAPLTAIPERQRPGLETLLPVGGLALEPSLRPPGPLVLASPVRCLSCLPVSATGPPGG